jgi:hypothetical protein
MYKLSTKTKKSTFKISISEPDQYILLVILIIGPLILIQLSKEKMVFR